MTTVTNKPYMAVASDMDGTLLLPDHSVTALTRETLLRVEKEVRVPVILATGRHHGDVLVTKKKLQLGGYVITSNGARVHDPENKVILKKNIDAGVARTLTLLTNDDPDITTSIYQGDSWRMNRDTKDFTDFYEENKEFFFYEIFDPVQHASYEDVYKVYYTSYNVDKLHALEAKVKAEYGEYITSAYSLPYAFEVMATGVNKGETLKQLLKEHIFPQDPRSGAELLKQCVCFGDGDNDVQMLLMAGKGCVMGNAQDRLLEKAPLDKNPHLERIGRNDENGVAKKLIEIFHLEHSQ